jgi:HD-GYP domain-containing protein (c-di-GMP phosphodiesterase class II)
MLRVPIEHAQAGMVLARSVADPEKPEHVLLKANYKLEQDRIARLRELRVYNIWIQYPGLDFLDKIIDPELVAKQQHLYSTLKKEFSDAQEQGLDKIDYKQYVKHMSDLFQILLQEKTPSSAFIAELQGGADDIFLHCTTVASLSLLIGMRLESYMVRARRHLSSNTAVNLTPLGVGALLHDMGKLSLPEDLRHFHLTAHDLGSPQWQQHTEAGTEMIHAGLDPCAGQIILNHHQHYDGSGFPARKSLPGGSLQPTLPLSGENIHIFCRIACVADRFDGFRHLPDGRMAPAVVGLKRMKNPGYIKWFDPEVYKAFISAMPGFNLGEQVILNNGQTVVVTELNDGEPCRPIVRPIDLAKAQPVENKKDRKNIEGGQVADIDLSLRHDLYIARVGDFDVTPYLH